MVSMVACHARDRGSNPGGPQSFFSLMATRKFGREVIKGYTSLYGVCKVIARLGSKKIKWGIVL